MWSGQKLKKHGWKTQLGKLHITLLVFSILFHNAVIAQQTIVKTDEKVIVKNSNGVRKHVRSNGFNSFNIEYQGTIEVTDDDKDIKSISPGGYIEISKTTFGSKRSLLLEGTSSGVRKQYYEGRSEVAFEPEGRKWLAEILPEVVRSTGIAAESRINRYYKQGGTDAVLGEISRLEGDYVRAIYGKILLKKDRMSADELSKSLRSLSELIDSDYYLAELLKDNSPRLLKDKKTADAYFSAVSGIGSDYYAAVVLKEALQSHQTSRESIITIVAASKNIGSDYYKAAVLESVLDQESHDDAIFSQLVTSMSNMESDYYQSQILTKAMRKKELSAEAKNKLLEAVSAVSSDYYMSSVFSDMLEGQVNEQIQVKVISLVDGRMSSDYYAADVLAKIARQPMSDQVAAQLAQAVKGLGSSNYASVVLEKAANASSLSSEALVALVDAAGSIDSDYYKASALQALAPLVRKSDNKAKAAYKEAAGRISSDTYFGKTMRAID